MIELDIDLSYLTKHFQIGTKQLQKYGENLSLKKIMEAEAAKGNKEAENFDLNVLKNPKELLKLFKLANPENKYKILRNLNETDLQYLVEFLEKDDLVMGLNFFTKEKLLDCIKSFPKEEIIKLAFDAFNKEDFLGLIPEKEMEKFFKSEKVDKRRLIETLSTFQPEVIKKLLEAATGRPQTESKTTPELMQEVRALKPTELQDGICSLNKGQKQFLILSLTQKDNDLWKEFDAKTLAKPFQQLDKSEIIESADVLDEEHLIKMLDDLPQDFMALVVMQIDPQIFADELCKNFKDVLSQVVAA